VVIDDVAMFVAILESTEAETSALLYILLSLFDLNLVQNQVFGLIALSPKSLFSTFSW